MNIKTTQSWSAFFPSLDPFQFRGTCTSVTREQYKIFMLWLLTNVSYIIPKTYQDESFFPILLQEVFINYQCFVISNIINPDKTDEIEYSWHKDKARTSDILTKDFRGISLGRQKFKELLLQEINKKTDNPIILVSKRRPLAIRGLILKKNYPAAVQHQVALFALGKASRDFNIENFQYTLYTEGLQPCSA